MFVYDQATTGEKRDFSKLRMDHFLSRHPTKTHKIGETLSCESGKDLFTQPEKKIVWLVALLNTIAWTGIFSFSGVWFWVFAALAVGFTAFWVKSLYASVSINRLVGPVLAGFFEVQGRTAESCEKVRLERQTMILCGIVCTLSWLLCLKYAGTLSYGTTLAVGRFLFFSFLCGFLGAASEFWFSSSLPVSKEQIAEMSKLYISAYKNQTAEAEVGCPGLKAALNLPR